MDKNQFEIKKWENKKSLYVTRCCFRFLIFSVRVVITSCLCFSLVMKVYREYQVHHHFLLDQVF